MSAELDKFGLLPFAPRLEELLYCVPMRGSLRGSFHSFLAFLAVSEAMFAASLRCERALFGRYHNHPAS